MDIDEKIKEEQLKYYQRENELRETSTKKTEESIKDAKQLGKAITIGLVTIFLVIFGSAILEFIKMLIQ